MADWRSRIRVVEDFPIKGISFKDITPALNHGPSLRALIDELAESVKGLDIDVIVGPEARGFLIGMPLAYALSAGFVPARRPGKLPPPTRGISYGLEYGAGELEIYRYAIRPGQRVLVVDDLLATGGTMLAVCEVVRGIGGTVAGVRFVLELAGLRGRDKLSAYDIASLYVYDES